MILVTRPFIGRLFDKKGHAIIILPGSVAIIIDLLVLSLAQSIAMLVVASLWYGLGVGAVALGDVAGRDSYAMMYRYSTLAMLVFLAVYLLDRARVLRQPPA